MLQPSEEIKSRIDIVDLIREYVPIKPAGLNFRGLCPFHREKTPSFMVSPEKQIWHCFGCGKGGDIFAFIMEMENVEFVEALRILAPKAGVVLKKEDKKVTSQRNRLLDIMDLCRRYYHKILLEADEAQSARDYLKKRGLDEETIEEWQIGVSPNSWDLTVNFLKKKGFSDNEIFLSGMSIKGTSRPGFYDRFRGRIMFPINDLNSDTVAFTARVSPEREAEEKMGKYINSPQTLIYNKSRILFGLDKAKQEIKKKNAVIIVEGQMDVIAAHQFGYKNTVASSGTALTADQIELLARRYTKNFIFALDFDAAGQLAVDRGESTVMRVDYKEIKAEDPQGKVKIYIDPALSYNLNVKIIPIAEGKDPDEFIRKNLTGWQQAVDNAKPIIEYYFDKIVAEKNLEKIDDRRQIAKDFLSKIIKLHDKIEQDFWLKKLSATIDVNENILRETLRENANKEKSNTHEGKTAVSSGEVRIISREEKISDLLLALMLRFSELIEYSISHFQPYYLKTDLNQALYRNLVFYYNNYITNNTSFTPLNKPFAGIGDNNSVTAGSIKSSIGEPDLTGSTDKNGQILNFGDFKLWLSKESDEAAISAKIVSVLDRIAILGDAEFYDFTPEQAKNEAINYIVALKKHYLATRMKELEKMIAEYEKAKDDSTVKELLAEFKVLADEMKDINQN